MELGRIFTFGVGQVVIWFIRVFVGLLTLSSAFHTTPCFDRVFYEGLLVHD